MATPVPVPVAVPVIVVVVMSMAVAVPATATATEPSVTTRAGLGVSEPGFHHRRLGGCWPSPDATTYAVMDMGDHRCDRGRRRRYGYGCGPVPARGPACGRIEQLFHRYDLHLVVDHPVSSRVPALVCSSAGPLVGW